MRSAINKVSFSLHFLVSDISTISYANTLDASSFTFSYPPFLPHPVICCLVENTYNWRMGVSFPLSFHETLSNICNCSAVEDDEWRLSHLCNRAAINIYLEESSSISNSLTATIFRCLPHNSTATVPSTYGNVRVSCCINFSCVLSGHVSDRDSAKLKRIIEEVITYSSTGHGTDRCPRAIKAPTAQIYKFYPWLPKDSKMLAGYVQPSYIICKSHDSWMWMYATNYLDRKFSRLRLPKRGSNTSRLRRKRYSPWSNRCSSAQWSFISLWVCSGGRNNRPRTHQMGKFPLQRVPPQTSSLWEPRWISTCSSRNRSVWSMVPRWPWFSRKLWANFNHALGRIRRL